MKNREKWIVAAFLAVILAVPLLSVAKGFLAPSQQEELTEDERAALENNGTIKNEDGAGGAGSSTGGMQTAQPSGDGEDTFFTKIQKGINQFTDKLFGRTELIAFNTELTSLLTGGTYIESTQVLLGKNNMLFYKTQQDGHPLWDYMGINHFAESDLVAIAENMTAIKNHLAEKGIEFYAMCVPNKEIIYEENMPDTVARVNDVSRGEQLVDYINDNTDIIFVYPKEALMENKDKAQLYYSTDSHSNQIGAFVNMQALFKEAYGTYAGMDTVEFDKNATDYLGDLAVMAGVSTQFGTDTVYVFDISSADPAQYNDQVLLFVGDSFGGFLSAVCKGYYREVYWEHPDSFEYSMYEKYQPDVVIWERSERYCEKFADSALYLQ